MTPSELKRLTSESEPFFFSRETLKFFGDTMKNYGVRKAEVLEIEIDYGTHKHNMYVIKLPEDLIYSENQIRIIRNVAAWELYRKRPVKCGRQDSAYFNAVTLGLIHTMA